MTRTNWFSRIREKTREGRGRLAAALFCYAALLAAALYTLLPARTSNEQLILGVFLLVLAVSIMKTIVHGRDQ